ncbi:hypothetical protein EC968_007869 [Mortierella alpina]|nr:hypothetical protein EC968_007869 [Mortierella alpina]
MSPWYKRTLSSEEALSRANVHFENAKKAKDRRHAQKLCDDAKEALDRMDISKSIKDHGQIIAAFRQHGDLLEKLGLPDKAQLSHSKADELRYSQNSWNQSTGAVDDEKSIYLTIYVLSAILSSIIDKSVPAPPLAPALPPVSTSSDSVVSALTISPRTAAIRDRGTVLQIIFSKDCPPPGVQFPLPGPDDRLTSTLQLAFCLALLKETALPLDTIDVSTRDWLAATEKNQAEKDRLKTLATDMIRALVRDELKDIKAISEVVYLASVLDRDDFRALLSLLVSRISNPVLLDVHALEGLAHMIQAAPRHIEADDLVKILDLLSTRLQDTFQQSPQYIYRLTRTVSLVLDAMADCKIQGLNRVNLHEPLLTYLDRLKSDRDPYIVYQAACAFQALLCVPDNEEPWQAVLRRSGTVIKGIGGLASAVKGLNVAEFITGLSTIQQGFQGAGQIFGLVVDAYNSVTSLKESGQGLLESLKNGLSFSHKRTWYAALRGADTLIQNGELTKFKALICQAPCRRDLAFQWGVCQRLGHLAADPVWDDDSRKDAIAFLGEIYWNDEEWGQEPLIKQCVLDTLMQLSRSISQGSMHNVVSILLIDLSREGDESKCNLYQSCIQTGPSAHTWSVSAPHLDSSCLIDQVQCKPSVEPALRKYQRHRIQEQEHRHAVYIPPQAKPTRESSDDDLFDLTTRVDEFLLAVDSKVLLLLGDSGAGKSTFNLELERKLWKEYNSDKKWIPLFVTLPAINMPEEDLIAKHLRRYEFTEVQIRELKSYGQIVLICDGYDECQKKDNLYNGNRLNRPGEWNVKMVISCRSEYLGSDYRVFFQPGGRNDRKGATQLQEAVVAPFSMDKINHYIKSYVTKYPKPGETAWTSEDYQRAIRRIPNLQDLVRNPFLLSLALEVLPRLVDLSEDLTSNQISRVTLYDQFVEQWVERGQIRLIERSKTGDDHVAFEMLSEDGFTRNAIEFMKSLAVAIFDEQEGKPVVEYSPIRDKSSWKVEFFGHGDGKNLLREACPLSRTGNQYRFIHRSVLEYALARAAFEPGQLGTDDQHSAEQLDVEYEDYRDGPSKGSSSSSPLFRKSFVHEHSIINFLSERVLQSVQFKNQLHRFIERSKSDMEASQAAANAITIFVQCASEGYLVADDLVKILSSLRARLQGTHQQSTEHHYQITRAVSQLFDAMAEHKVQDVNRVLEHEPLSAVLSGLMGSSDPFLLYQASYAYQALQYVPEEETALQIVLRYSTGDVAMISDSSKLDVESVVDGLRHLQRITCESIGIVRSVYESVKSTIETGQGVLDGLREGLTAATKHPWYPALRAADYFVRQGQVADLYRLILMAPCRRDSLFQWGICQLLDEIAADTTREVDTRQKAIDVLMDLFENDPDWGYDDSVRVWMLAIFRRLAQTTDTAIKLHVTNLLGDLLSRSRP